ncbi:MAG: hypothetical protein AAF710_09615 [Planctomycetota bacterium]
MRRHLNNFWPLPLILLAALPAFLISLGNRDVARVMENVSVGSSQETWHAWHANPQPGVTYPDRNVLVLPTWNGEPRVNKPPMLVWVNLLAAELTGHDPGTTDAKRFILICRVVTVLFALLAVAAVYGLGLHLGDRTLAVFAAAVLVTMWCVVRAGRTASYDGHLLGWGTLAVAAAVVGSGLMQPLPPSTRRRWLGWSVAAAATTAAVMTKGPLAWAVVGLPLLVLTLVDFKRWRIVLIGLMATGLVSAAAFAGWFFAVERIVPQLGETLAVEYAAQRNEAQPVWYYAVLLVMAVPWTPWLIAGLVHPFLYRPDAVTEPDDAKRARRLRLLPWVWFVTLLVFFSIPGAKQQRYILPAVPAAALLCAFVLRDHWRVAGLGKPDRGAWLLQRPVGAVAVVGSVALPLLLAGQGWLQARGWIDDLNLAPIAAGSAVVLGFALLALSLPAEHKLRKHRLVPGVLLLAAWMTLVTATTNRAYALRSAADDPAPAAAARLLELADGRPIVYLRPDEPTQPDVSDEEPLLVHLRRAVPVIDDTTLTTYTGRAVVIGEPTDINDTMLADLGYAPAFDFVGDKQRPRRVYAPAASP